LETGVLDDPAQGGRMWVGSRPGGGSEFGFALPLVDPGDIG
jgi:signal transduction histidine kinase